MMGELEDKSSDLSHHEQRRPMKEGDKEVGKKGLEDSWDRKKDLTLDIRVQEGGDKEIRALTMTLYIEMLKHKWKAQRGPW